MKRTSLVVFWKVHGFRKVHSFSYFRLRYSTKLSLNKSTLSTVHAHESLFVVLFFYDRWWYERRALSFDSLSGNSLIIQGSIFFSYIYVATFPSKLNITEHFSSTWDYHNLPIYYRSSTLQSLDILWEPNSVSQLG